MKNHNRGFVAPLFIATVTIILIGVGVYFFGRTQENYYTYINKTGSYSIYLPSGWGVLDINIDKQNPETVAIPSAQEHLDYRNTSRLVSAAKKYIRVLKIEDLRNTGKLGRLWLLPSEPASKEVIVPDQSSFVKSIKVIQDGRGFCTYKGFELEIIYRALINDNEEYSIIGCSYYEADRAEIERYLVKIIQTLRPL